MRVLPVVVISAVLAACHAAEPVPAARPSAPLVIVTNCGVDMDDQWVIAHACLRDEPVAAVIATHAEQSSEAAAEHCARDVLVHLPQTAQQPAVLRGAAGPLASGVQTSEAATWLAEARGPLHLLLIGAATDVALALRQKPALEHQIAVTALAFESWPNGGDRSNVHDDPDAWRVLFASRTPLTIGDAGVARRDLTIESDGARAHFGTSPTALYLISLLERWVAGHPQLVQQVSGTREDWPVWDAVVMADVLGVARITERPRPRLRDDLGLETGTGPAVRWIVRADGQKLWRDLGRRLVAEGATAR